MKNAGRLLLVIAAAAALALAVWLRIYLPDWHSAPLPHPIGTVMDGYPYALQFQQRFGPATHLTTAQVSLKRKKDHFEVSTINYRFVSETGGGEVVFAGLVNWRRRIYGSHQRRRVPHDARFPGGESQPLVLSARDVPEILQIAATNGLDAFCAQTRGESDTVSLTLGSSTNGAFWIVSGLPENDNVDRLYLEIDARSGAVLSRSEEEAFRRRAPR